MVLVAQEKMRHCRHQRIGQNVGGNHREDDRHRQQPKRVTRRPALGEDGVKDDADTKQRDRRRAMISCAPWVMAVRMSSPCSSMWRLMFSMVTVASSTRIPTASAKPPSVINIDRLAKHRKHGQRAKHRQWYRNGDDEGRAPTAKSRIMKPVTPATISPSRTTAATEIWRKTRLIGSMFEIDPSGSVSLNSRQARFYAAMMSRVEAEAEISSTDISTPLRPSDCTTFVWRRTVVNMGDIAHEEDHGAVDHFNRQIIEIFNGFWKIVEVDSVLRQEPIFT